jgi:hypothetical protein
LFGITHHGITAFTTNKTALVSVMSAAMDVILDAFGECDSLPDRIKIQITIKVNPLTAIAGPRLTTKSLAYSASQKLVFQRFQVMTNH